MPGGKHPPPEVMASWPEPNYVSILPGFPAGLKSGRQCYFLESMLVDQVLR